jgi:hypothetical protein
VPKATVDANQFNAAEARRAKFGCDPKSDEACRKRLSEAVVANK